MKKLLTILFFIPLFCFSQIDYDNLIKFTNLSPYTCESYLSSSFGIIKKIYNSKNNTIDKNFCGNCDSIDNLIKIQLLNDGKHDRNVIILDLGKNISLDNLKSQFLKNGCQYNGYTEMGFSYDCSDAYFSIKYNQFNSILIIPKEYK